MARGRTLYLPVMIAAAVLVACAVVLLAVSGKAGATFPCENGRMAYTSTTNGVIYSLEPGGGAKTKIAGGHQPSFSPDGNGVARAVLGSASAREASSGTSEGFKPSGGAGPAYKASEKLQITKAEAGARVTLNWVYAEENYVSVGYQVETLKDDRTAAGHPAELQPILGFGYGEPTPREEEYLKKYGLGDEVVALTDERGTDFRMVDNYGTVSGGPKPVEGPMENLVAFRLPGLEEPYYVYAVPVDPQRGDARVVEAGKLYEPAAALVVDVAAILATGIGVAFLLSIAAAYLIARPAVR